MGKDRGLDWRDLLDIDRRDPDESSWHVFLLGALWESQREGYSVEDDLGADEFPDDDR